MKQNKHVNLLKTLLVGSCCLELPHLHHPLILGILQGLLCLIYFLKMCAICKISSVMGIWDGENIILLAKVEVEVQVWERAILS
jgi:hypothetical protein